MKKMVVVLSIGSVVIGVCLYASWMRVIPVSAGPPIAQTVAAPVSVQGDENVAAAEPGLAESAASTPSAAPPPGMPARGHIGTRPGVLSTQASVDAASVERSVDLLVSPQSTRAQKQAAWKELRDGGKLDLAIAQLEQRVSADPGVPEIAATLGQAYLKKCAAIQDLREQGILAMQADKLFDTALNLDPSNWEARFTKAVALSYWPPSMNKGDEVIQHFQTLMQQQESQPPQPHFAETYAWLGEQYQHSGHSDYAVTVWERGASLFPNDEGLKKKLAAANVASGTTEPGK